MTDPIALRQKLYLVADEMRNMAALSKYFAANVYEAERATRIMTLASEVAALADGETSTQESELRKAYFEDGAWQRFSPAIGVDAAVFTPDGQMLLIRRKDSGLWAMPGGIAEVGLSFPESALKELWEEAGLRGRVERILGLFDRRYWESTVVHKVHLISVVFQITCEDCTPSPGIECLDARFFPVDSLPPPEQFHGSHAKRVQLCVELWRSGQTYFDPADSRSSELPNHQRPSEVNKLDQPESEKKTL